MKIIIALLALVAVASANHHISPTPICVQLPNGIDFAHIHLTEQGEGVICAEFIVDPLLSSQYAVVEFQFDIHDTPGEFPRDANNNLLYPWFRGEESYCCDPSQTGQICVPFEGCGVTIYGSVHLWVVELLPDGSRDDSKAPIHVWICGLEIEEIYVGCEGETTEIKHGGETFLAKPEDGDYTGDELDYRNFGEMTGSPRWGWNICVYKPIPAAGPAPGKYRTYTWAGAAQNDISRGYNVGYVDVEFVCAGGYCDVNFEAFGYSGCQDGDNNVISQVHIEASQSQLGTYFSVFPKPVNFGGFAINEGYSPRVSYGSYSLSQGCDFDQQNSYPCDNARFPLTEPTATVPVCFVIHGVASHFCSPQGVLVAGSL